MSPDEWHCRSVPVETNLLAEHARKADNTTSRSKFAVQRRCLCRCSGFLHTSPKNGRNRGRVRVSEAKLAAVDATSASFRDIELRAVVTPLRLAEPALRCSRGVLCTLLALKAIVLISMFRRSSADRSLGRGLPRRARSHFGSWPYRSSSIRLVAQGIHQASVRSSRARTRGS